MSRIKNFAKNLCLTILSITLVVISLEIFLRFTPYKHLTSRDKYIRHYYVADLAKGHDIRPNVKNILTSVDRDSVQYEIWSNELGCFDRPYNGEKDYILLVGDSFVHSFAPFQYKWGTFLENLLSYRVLRCGVPAYGTKQEYLKAKDILAKIKNNPQLIILGYCWNDLEEDYMFPFLTVYEGFLAETRHFKNWETGELQQMTDLEGWYKRWSEASDRSYPANIIKILAYFLGRHSIIYNLITDTLTKLSPPEPSYSFPTTFLAYSDFPWVRVAWEQHLENLSEFKKLAAHTGARLLIVIIPTNVQVYPFLADWRNVDPEKPNKILHKFLNQEGILYLDLLPLFRGYADQKPRRFLSSEKDLYWRFNSHWSLKGERLAGLLVAKYILENDYLKVNDKDDRLKEIQDELRALNR